MHNVDSSLNEDGSVTEIVNTILHVNGHSKRTTFTVTNLRKLDIILRFTWLVEHNPEINWQTHKVTLSFCKGNLSMTVESHTVLTEGKSKEKSLRIPQPQGEYSIYYGNPLGHGYAPCLPDINPDCQMGNWRCWGLDEGEVVIERGRIF